MTTERNPVATKARLALNDASAASQAVGPPGSPVEMSCGGRTFADIGRRMLDSLVLSHQRAARPAGGEVFKNATAGKRVARMKFMSRVQLVLKPAVLSAP